MSFWAQIEADYNAVIASADSVAVKLENLMGIQTRAQEMTTLTNQFTAIVDNGALDTPTKVTQLLTLVGKL
jgi:hypothetical protein